MHGAVWILLDLSDPNAFKSWSVISSMCTSPGRLGVVLTVPDDLPDGCLIEPIRDSIPTTDLPDYSEFGPSVSQWIGQPVKALVIRSETFLTNARGMPVLSRAHQRVVSEFMHLKAQVILHNKFENENEISNYFRYLYYIGREWVAWTNKEISDDQYRDYLQCPLQPLADNLQSITYEVFEQDPVKYSQYGYAVEKALIDKFEINQTAVVMVGAIRCDQESCSGCWRGTWPPRSPDSLSL